MFLHKWANKAVTMGVNFRGDLSHLFYKILPFHNKSNYSLCLVTICIVSPSIVLHDYQYQRRILKV